jgi:hypothetical protein
MGDRRKTRGPTYGRTKLSRPVVVRPGTLRAGILAGRLHFFSLAQGHLTSRTQCRPPQDSRATCIRRAASSGGLLATSFGGLHPFTGLSTHPEDTKLSTNKQHSLSWAPGQRRAVRCTKKKNSWQTFLFFRDSSIDMYNNDVGKKSAINL